MDDTGKIVREVKVANEPDALLAILTNRRYHFNRRGLIFVMADDGTVGASQPCETDYSALGERAFIDLVARRSIPLLPSPAPKKNWALASITGEGTILKVTDSGAETG